MNGKTLFNRIAPLTAALLLAGSAIFVQQSIADDSPAANSVSTSRTDSSNNGKSKRVNLNTASKSELESLPGVGPTVADNIIAARPFKTVSDLKSVSGIGEQRFLELRPHVTIGAAADRKTGSGSGGPANASSAYSSGSEKPGAEARAKSYTPAGSPPAPGSTAAVTTDSTHLGSDKPGIREKEETRANPSASSTARNNGAKVNINTASKQELEALPGIGPVKAQAIIDNRPYNTPEDLMKVTGIKEGTYDKIRDQITVR